jgi:lysophospholipase L1-like esterase
MKRVTILTLILLVTGQGFGSAEEAAFTNPSFVEAIQRFEVENASGSIPTGGIVFYGSSTIRMWKLEESFPGTAAINRGFGGSHIADCILAATRAVIPLQPRLIVFYAGDNDVAKGKSADQVLQDFQRFTRVIRKSLPETRILFLSIKPSTQRWVLYPTMKQANQLIQESIKSDPNLRYLELGDSMLGEDGLPKSDLFISDGLHLSEKGYQLWTAMVAPLLKIDSGPPR